MLKIWRALLLAQTQGTQGHELVMFKEELTAKATSLVANFLPDVSPRRRSPEHSSLELSQDAGCLLLVHELWMVFKDVSTLPWITAAAAKILTIVLKCPFDLSNATVMGAWSSICTDLIAVGLPDVMRTLVSQSDAAAEVELHRQLWQMVAKSWNDSSKCTDWTDAVLLLVLPFRCVIQLFLHSHEFSKPTSRTGYGHCLR